MSNKTVGTQTILVEQAKPVAVVVTEESAAPREVVVTNDTVRRVNATLAGGGNELVRTGGIELVTVGGTELVAAPQQPREFFDETKKHKRGKLRGHKATVATVATERELLDDIARHRAALVENIDELHTRLSPKYQLEQLKSTWKQAGTDALSILKNEGAPVDESRKKKAESIVKAGGALGGLVALGGLRKLLKGVKTRREMRKAVAKGMPQEHLDILGVVETLDNEVVDTDKVQPFTETTDKLADAVKRDFHFEDAEVVEIPAEE